MNWLERMLILTSKKGLIVKINSSDSFEIEEIRRDIYAFERRGIQQKAGEFFRFYYKVDFVGKFGKQGTGSKENLNSSRLDTKRSRGQIKANRIVEFNVDEERGIVSITYANGVP